MILDHFAIAAETLEEGRAYVEATLGVALRPGGKHTHFGTHNMLLGLSDGLYLEVIAKDPDAPSPDYPRWFDLDNFSGGPRPTTWICRTDDLNDTLRSFPDAGTPVSLARGDLRWQMAVPKGGALPLDGLFPALIEWQCASHPAALLPPSGCALKSLVISHPDAMALGNGLCPTMNDKRVVFETGPPGLRAEIEAPSGLKVLQ